MGWNPWTWNGKTGANDGAVKRGRETPEKEKDMRKSNSFAEAVNGWGGHRV